MDSDAMRAIVQSEKMMLNSYLLIQEMLDQANRHKTLLDAAWKDLMAKKERMLPPLCDLASKKRRRPAQEPPVVAAIVVA
jgi:hypothetical protein